MLFVSPDTRKGFMEILRAGAAEVVDASPEPARIAGITHAFFDAAAGMCVTLLFIDPFIDLSGFIGSLPYFFLISAVLF